MDCVGGSRSSDKTSYFECSAPCDPCFSKGSVKAASTYCKQCQEHMCVSCTSTHSGLNISRDHVCTTVTGSDLPLSEEPGKTKQALSYCSKHGDKEIQWFCKTHEVMFCDTCKRAKHRQCQVMSVCDLTSSEHGESLDQFINALLSLKSRIAQLKSGREKSAEDLKKFKKSCKEAVRQFKSNIMDKLERLEKKILSDIDKVVTTEKAVVQDHVQTCDSLFQYVEAELTTADAAKISADDVTSVIAVYEVSNTLRTIEPTVYELENEAYNVHIAFQPSSELTDMISAVDKLGILDIDRTEIVVVAPSVSTSRSTHPVSGRKPVADMEVVSSTEVKVPSEPVTGLAVMPDGRIILADGRNSQIILIDQEFMSTIQSTLTLPSNPWDMAVYGDNAVVVTMPDMKQLQYFYVDKKLRAGRTIPTELRCWGVAIHGGEIYVTVSVGFSRQVRVLDTRGKVTRIIAQVSGRISYITVGRGGTLYISDYLSGHITCYTNAGDVVYDVKHEGMTGTQGMLVDEDDNLLVCCCKSSNIHVLGKDGAHRRVILSSADGLVRPESVSYRRSDQTLIVTMYNTPSVRAYTLK